MAKNNNLTDFLTDVADAIRAKKGTSGKINPQDFANEIASIQTGSSDVVKNQHKSVEIESNGSQSVYYDAGYTGLSSVSITTNVQPKLEEKTETITTNGTKTITPSTDKDGLSKVTIVVDVPTDETDVNIESSKAVSLTSQGATTINPSSGYDAMEKVVVTPMVQSKTTTITENKEITITPDSGYVGLKSHKIIVNVPDGGGGTTPIAPVESKDVNFYDYDGTLLYSYTIAEAAALPALPPTPTPPDGMDLSDNVSWNYALDEIKGLGGLCDVGAMYSRKNAGMTLFLDIPINGVTITSGIKGSSSASKYTIDWGDGTTENVTGMTAKSHTYSSRGIYKVKFDITSGTLGLTSNQNVMGDNISSASNRSNSVFLRSVVIGTGCTLPSAFKYCGGLETCILSPEVSVTANMFSDCSSLKALMTQGTISASALLKCTSLKVVSMSLNSVVAGVSVFGSCFSLKRLILPNKTSGSALPACYSSCTSLSVFKIYKGYNSINAAAFDGHYGLSILDLTDYDSVPTLSGSISGMKVSQGVKILVKSNMEEAFKSASNWSSISSFIVGV